MKGGHRDCDSETQQEPSVLLGFVTSTQPTIESSYC